MSSTQKQSAFRHRVDRYDTLIDWPKRLANEMPFYRELFDQVGIRRVLDTACGTGRHAKLFHEWGLEVEGADASPAMIAWCRDRHGEAAGLRWVERSYTRPADPPGRFDAVICVGNSLALADASASVAPAVVAMLASLRPGGICIIQVLNLWRLPDGPTQWQKCVRASFGTNTDHILLKSIRRTGSRAFIDFVDVELLPGGKVKHESECDSFLGIRSDDLAAAARDAGAEEIALFGNYQHAPYSPDHSPDLICVCRKP